MKRETKFRAWSINKDGTNGSMSFFTLEEMAMDMGYVNIDSVMQYTGLSDKKNVEIYEGDIMKRKASHSVDMLCKKCGSAIDPLEKDYIHDVIVFDEGSFKGQFDIKRAGYFDTISVYPLDLCEVIGNVYENPELLD